MARRDHQQLTLAFVGRRMALMPIPGAATRMSSARTPTDPSTARTTATAKVARTRTMPARDSRGRFVSLPTTEVPSWYVFCADSYRIPGESLADATAPVSPTARQPLPRAVARTRCISRMRLTRADLLTYLVLAVGYIAVLWYGLHLPRPNR